MANVIKFEDTLDPAKTTSVNKLIEVSLDLGHLLASDTNDLDLKALRSEKTTYLANLTRDNAQLLINSLWELPTERYEDTIVAKLPKPNYILPREKPVPPPKVLTKWEQFAKEKGIRKKKKTNVEWDDILKRWVPRYGFKKTAAEKEKDWLIEVPESADPFEDQFEKKSVAKTERVSKNEFQRMRNIAKSQKIKVPSMGLPPTQKMTSAQFNTAAKVAHVSTASLGKFQPKSSKEKLLSKGSVLQNKKRKAPHPSGAEEQERNLKLAESLLRKKPKLDVGKAVNRQIHEDEQETSERKKGSKKKAGSKGKKLSGGKFREKPKVGGAKGGKKSKGGQGKRQFGKNSGGRKRR